MEAPNARRVA